MAQLSLEDVRRGLQDVDRPAGKDDLVAAAERQGASEDVVRALRALPLADHADLDEVARSVDTVEAAPAAKESGAQARVHDHAALAERQRDSRS